MKFLGYENIEITKNPMHRIGESADKLRVRVLKYNDIQSGVISGLLYEGDYERAYKKCVERFGETDTLTHWAYELCLQWKVCKGMFQL